MGGSDRGDYDKDGDYRYGSPTPNRTGPGWQEPQAAEGEGREQGGTPAQQADAAVQEASAPDPTGQRDAGGAARPA